MMGADRDRIVPGQNWKVDLFREKDAPGVVRLFRSVYGDGYPVKTFIDAKRLAAENRARRVISSVARTESGEVVGHNALFQSAPYKGIYESGAGLVHRDYRGGRGIFTAMVKHGFAVAARDFGVETIFGEPVCNHVFTQKMMHGMQAVTMALEVDLMPAEAYTRESSAPGRVSTLLAFKTCNPKTQTVYIPPGQEELFALLYGGFDDRRRLLPAEAQVPAGAATRIESRYFAFAQVARVAVWQAGTDFEKAYCEYEASLENQGATVIQAWLNTGQPWVGRPVDLLSQRGYFVAGVLPRWFDSDAVLMLKLFHTPHWVDINLEFQRDQDLLERVRRNWQKSFGH